MTTEQYNVFDKANHLLPEFDRTEFNELTGWDFGWAILQTINIAKSQDENIKLSIRLSPGQKALYFFWYLDAKVTNGGFIQFYVNGYRKYLPPIIDGLRLIGDTNMLVLIEKADKYYLENEALFIQLNEYSQVASLYKQLETFEIYDQRYYDIHDETMHQISIYARQHPDYFVRFKN